MVNSICRIRIADNSINIGQVENHNFPGVANKCRMELYVTRNIFDIIHICTYIEINLKRDVSLYCINVQLQEQVIY